MEAGVEWMVVGLAGVVEAVTMDEGAHGVERVFVPRGWNVGELGVVLEHHIDGIGIR